MNIKRGCPGYITLGRIFYLFEPTYVNKNLNDTRKN